jgi:hypothetical protein
MSRIAPGLPCAGVSRHRQTRDRQRQEQKNRQYVRVNEVSEEHRRLTGAWAAGCAERVLPLFEAKGPQLPCIRRRPGSADCYDLR